jgi:DNA-binding winged helix-turn-helix (wHTH) protein/TolB-like protein/cytochrome c-type biogenesis protein CcmH/NrfG
MASEIRKFYEFGRFRFDVQTHCLRFEDELVQLPPKSLSALGLLLANRGDVVKRETLLDTVWEESYVDDANLTVAVSGLRKTLAEYNDGDNYIQTISRKGYRFTAAVEEKIEIRDEPIVVSRQFVEQLTFRRAKTSQSWFAFAATSLLVLIVIAGGILAWNLLARASVSTQITMAVLPLRPIGNDETDKALGLGLTDVLISKLGSVNQVVVRPASAVLKFEGTDIDPLEMGKRLSVDAVLEGTIQRVDGKLRVNARLIRVRNGEQIWANALDVNESNIYELQDTISEQLVRSILPNLKTVEGEDWHRSLTTNANAYEAYLRGRYFWNRRTDDDLRKAEKYFDEATKLDPKFAEAYVGLADAEYLLYDHSYDTSAEHPLHAKDNLLKALALRPDSVDALTTLGLIQSTYDWNWAESERSFVRALEIAPNSSNAHQRYGGLLLRLRRFDEAKAELEKARVLDPLSPGINMNVGVAFYFAGDLKEAERWFRNTIEIEPEFVPVSFYLARCLWREGRQNDALTQWGTAIRLDGDDALAREIETKIAVESPTALFLFWRERWQGQLNESGITAKDLAIVSSFLNDREATLGWLELSFKGRHPWTPVINADPEFDFVRDEPRFQQLLRQMDLPN